MTREFELCRWPGDGIRGLKFCGKPIPRNAKLDYCEEHLARLPLWPQEA